MQSATRNLIMLFAIAAAAVIVTLLIGALSNQAKKSEKIIAYVGRFSNYRDTIPLNHQKPNPFDKMHETVLRQYLNELNTHVANAQFTLKTFDNRRDPRVSDSLYRYAIAPDTNIVMVIDNTWGEHLQPAAATIRDQHIPVISMNADRGKGDYGDAALFIGSDDDTPQDVSAFLRRALHCHQIIFITEVDYPLHEVYQQVFTHDSVTVIQQFDVVGKKSVEDQELNLLLRRLRDFFARSTQVLTTPVVINAHQKWGNKIVEFLDKNLNDATIVAPIMALDVAVANKIGGNNNQLLVVSRPNDAVSRKLSNDLDGFRTTSPELFASASAPFFLKRCQDVAAILAGMPHLDSVAPSRASVRRYLSSLRDSLLVGEHDLYEFKGNRLVKDIYFTRYRGRQYYSYPIQLNTDREVIPNLFFGVDVLDIYDIDANNNTFKSDFFYWVKVDTGHRDAERNLIFQNLMQNESSRELVMQKMEEDIEYKLYKVSGTFHHDFALAEYPLDKQEIAIKVEILAPSNKLKISFDQSSLDEDEKIFERFKVQAWNKLKYYVTVDNRIAATMRGDPDNREGKPTVFKNFSFRLLVERKFLGPFLQIVLPLILIGFVAISLLYITDISFENLGEVSAGTFLGIITFSIALSNITPSSDYLTKADLLFWVTFMVVLVSFITVIVVNSRFRLEQLQGVSIRPISYALTVVYPLCVLWVLLWY